MPILNAPVNSKVTSLSAVITRADGRVENLGIIAYHHQNPLINYVVNRWIKWKEFRRKGR